MSALMVVPVQGGSAHKIGPDVASNGWTAWSADGRFLFVVRQGTDPKTPLHNQVWRVPLDDGAPEPLGITGENVGDLRLDPSGRRLAFVSGSETSELWVMEHILPRAARTAQSRR
jgi:dipeptidyl aminopeptidase/acylaminoacyl peptidase